MNESVPEPHEAHAGSFHEPSLQALRRVVPGNRSVFCSFPKSRELSEKHNYKGSLQKTYW